MQQLCEAGEAEFLEIMDLVGMAAKPMHVRRLQKALQEWVQNPGRTSNFLFAYFAKIVICIFAILGPKILRRQVKKFFCVEAL